MNAVFVHADRATLTARRECALASVGLAVDDPRKRVESGRALPDEREAWEEVDAVDFLPAEGSGPRDAATSRGREPTT